MEFGSFVEEMRPRLTQAEGFREMLRHVDAAEAWGLDAVWLGEIHCNSTRSVLSAPLVMAGTIFGRTRRLRVGTAVHLLPLNHPLRIAEEVATLDHVSEGRFDFGVGRSGNPRAYDAYGIPYAESQGRFREALEIIRRAWEGEAFTYRGQFYQIQTTAVSPRPYQVPHPPIRMAATSPETFSLVARLGLAVLVGLRTMDIDELSGHLRTYRAAWRQAGHAGRGSVHLRIPLYADRTEQAARDEPRETITHYMRRQAEITRQPLGRADAGPAAGRLSRAADLERLTYDEILKTRVAFGSAAGLIDRLTALRDELGLDGLVAELNPGGLLPSELEMQSLRVLTQDVMPAFK
jgi:alkanesulfonate monooxygenase SsuD/methylene tetrahydromethanopterin reductase-like flavin-dependent oxidoreductase (luciferase family)